jgi:hypothetical protein
MADALINAEPASKPPTLRDSFPHWYGASVSKDMPSWTSHLAWSGPSVLEAILLIVENDLAFYWGQSPDQLTKFAASVIDDLQRLEQDPAHLDGTEQLQFVRFFLASKVVRHSITHGRSGLAFDWLVCSITERAFEHFEPGLGQEVNYQIDRLIQFPTSAHPCMSSTAPALVLNWFADLYYYSRKFGGLRDLADLVLPEARESIRICLESGEEQLRIEAINAASLLASWAEQRGSDEAASIARTLARMHREVPLSAEAKKLICMTLATVVGRHTDRSPPDWAKTLLADHANLLAQHDPVHYLIASCATPEEHDAQHAEIVARVELFAAEAAAYFNGDRAAICFRQLQLFDILTPHIRHLIERGRCQACIELVAAWFGVPPDRRRTSPVICVVPAYEQGMLYAVEHRPIVIERDTRAALIRMTTAINHAFDTNIVIRDDHSFGPHQRAGRRGSEQGLAEELLTAITSYYELERFEPVFREISHKATAVFQPHAVHTPLQALTLNQYGSTWPSVASFEEPCADRPIRRVLIWTCGTNLGGYEGRAVEAIFRAAGVECEMYVEEDITPEQFLQFYCDERFDVIWTQAHGQFHPNEPHKAYIELSADKTQILTVADLIRHAPPGTDRRLLFLNICLGGAVLGTEAPPRLGLGALIAAANQAVVSHLWEVSSFAAPLFGAMAAIRLARGDGFFPAYCFATRNLRTQRDAALHMLRDHMPNCDSTAELIERFERGPFGVDVEDVRTWGSPVFYE